MNWQQGVRERYLKEGREAFRTAENRFVQLITRFCAEHNLSILEDSIEGKDWIILLKDGTELYVDRHSYYTDKEATSFWVTYDFNKGGVIAEFSRQKKIHVFIPNDEIAEICDKWYSE